MRKKKISFRAPEHIVDMVMDLKRRKGLEDATAAFNYILKDYFDKTNTPKEGSTTSHSDGYSRAIIDEIEFLRSENRDILKMLLIIGTTDDKTKDAFQKTFRKYFKHIN